MRLSGIVLLVVVVILLLVGAWALLDVYGGATARTVWNHTWRSLDGAELGGYITAPNGPDDAVRRLSMGRPSGTSRSPAVLFIPDRNGLSVDTTVLCDSLAADGFVVMAPDLFRGRMATGRLGALILGRRRHDQRLVSDVDRALAELKSVPYVDAGRVAVVGFNFGGGVALDLGARDATLRGVGAVSPGPPPESEQAVGRLGRNGPVVVVYGGRDRNARGGSLDTFESLLAERDYPYALRVIEGGGRSFISLKAIAKGGPAREAWNVARAFLQSALY